MRLHLHAFAVFLGLLGLYACKTDPATDPDDGKDASAPADGGSSGGNRDSQTQGDGAAPPPVPKVNTSKETIDVDGTSRSYVLSVPKTYDQAKAYPVVLALHGDDDSADTFSGWIRFDTVSGDEAIVAYPSGAVDLFTPFANNNDLRMLEVIVEHLKSSFNVDTGKIWGFGYSKGGYILSEVACKKPGLLSAMAIHAGGAPQANNSGEIQCARGNGTATIVIHGAEDDIAGGEYCADYWAGRAGCDGTRTASTPAICEKYDGCNAGTPVVFCTIPQWGHGLWDNATRESWTWFTSL